MELLEIKVNGKFKTRKELDEEVKDLIVDALVCMSTDEALYLGNHIRENIEEDILYENNEDNINEQLDGWTPWDLINMDYESTDFFYLSYGEPEFTGDVWANLSEEDIATEIMEGAYSDYINSDIQDILDEYEEAKETLTALTSEQIEGAELLARFTNCEADVSDLLQFIDKLVRKENG